MSGGLCFGTGVLLCTTTIKCRSGAAVQVMHSKAGLLLLMGFFSFLDEIKWAFSHKLFFFNVKNEKVASSQFPRLPPSSSDEVIAS